MPRSILFLLVFATAAVLTALAEEPPRPCAEPPFERAILFSGLGPDCVVYLGVYDAVVDAGRPPEVIFGTSGGALAAAIIAAKPDRTERSALLASEEFHRFLLNSRIVRPRVVPLLVRSLGWSARARGMASGPPDLLTPPFIDMPQDLGLPALDRPFPTGAERPRVVLIASRINPAFHRPRGGDRKYLSEAWFTDRDTARYLAGRRSPIGTNYPESYVAACGFLPCQTSLAVAARASMAEPYMAAPTRVHGDDYVGGGIDLWPTEVARLLARQVIVPRTARFTGLHDAGAHSSFGFSQRERQLVVEAQPAEATVDLTDSPGGRDRSFWPVGVGLRIEAGVPADRAEFQRRVAAQYRYGYERGAAAFCGCGLKPGSR